MDVPHYRALAEFFTRFTTAINEARSDAEFREVARLFDAPEFSELAGDSQDELRDHYAHRHSRRLKV